MRIPRCFRLSPRAWLMLLALLAINHLLELRGFFEPHAIATYDWFQRFTRNATIRPEPLVTAFTLAPAPNLAADEVNVVRTAQVLACGRPAVIGIDWRWEKWAQNSLEALREGPAARIPIVWAQEIGGSAAAVAGGTQPRENWKSGVAAVPLDWDRAVRSHRRFFDNRESFSWALVREFCRVRPDAVPACREIEACVARNTCASDALLSFVDGSDLVDWLPAEAALEAAGENAVDCASLPNGGANPAVTGKIVLIGDHSVSDSHPTPFGRRLGVLLIGQAIQSDLRGAKLQAVHSHWVLFPLHLLSVVIVIAVNGYLSPFKALFMNIVGLPVVCVALSFAAFQTGFYWVNFVPVIGGAIIHQLWEQAEKNDHLLKGNRKPHSEDQDTTLPQP